MLPSLSFRGSLGFWGYKMSYFCLFIDTCSFFFPLDRAVVASGSLRDNKKPCVCDKMSYDQ